MATARSDEIARDEALEKEAASFVSKVVVDAESKLPSLNDMIAENKELRGKLATA